MKLSSYRLLQFLLWSICAYHLGVGFGLNVSAPGFLQFMAAYYGAQVDWTAQFLYILKPLGAYMLVMGGLAAAAALKPLANRAIVYGFAALFILRALQRVIFAGELIDAFGIPPARNIGNVIFFLGLAAVLLGLYHYVIRRQPLEYSPAGR